MIWSRVVSPLWGSDEFVMPTQGCRPWANFFRPYRAVDEGGIKCLPRRARDTGKQLSAEEQPARENPHAHKPRVGHPENQTPEGPPAETVSLARIQHLDSI